jgi:hypothetical protein
MSSVIFSKVGSGRGSLSPFFIFTPVAFSRCTMVTFFPSLKSTYTEVSTFGGIDRAFKDCVFPVTVLMFFVKKGIKERVFRTVPIGLKQVLIVARVQRLECKDCGLTRQESLSWVDKKKTYTRRLANLVLSLLAWATVKDVAKHTGLAWHTVKEIEKAYLRGRYSKPRLRHLRHLQSWSLMSLPCRRDIGI